MGKKSPSPPPAPDPVKTANAQAAANRETAITQSELNMVNQYTPYGSLEYSQRGTGTDGTPLYSATTTLSPEQQQILNLQNQAGIQYGETANQQLSQVRDRLAQPLDYSSLGEAPRADQAAWDTAYNALLKRNQPQADQRLAALETRLANQGIGYGSEAWQRAMDDYNRGQNDFGIAAQLAATGEMGQRFNMEALARDRAINEMIQQRQIPLNELAAMMSGSQVQNPNFVGTPQTQVGQTPIADSIYASYNGQMNAYNANLQNQAANNQGLYGLLGAGANAFATLNPFGWSDVRLKNDICRIGTLDNGLGVYRFRYIWGGPETVGLMAQEVQRIIPHAVRKFGDYLAVNYREALSWR
ncbi:MAG TPA: hypothetical protein DCF73_02495 [Rhodobiaceae bacterium]|nr:hypothetical protein [Rhodobiaceae bacterium]